MKYKFSDLNMNLTNDLYNTHSKPSFQKGLGRRHPGKTVNLVGSSHQPDACGDFLLTTGKQKET